jgi:hypothetical protein
MKNTIELRYQPTDLTLIRAEGVPLRISGHAAVFDSRANIDGLFLEEIQRGAFADFLATGEDVVLLWNHNRAMPLGRTSAGTLRVYEDQVGLAIEWNPPESAVREVEAIQRGDIKGMSLNMLIDPKDQVWSRPVGTLPLRTIKRASVVEVSPAAFPYYRSTDISVRSAVDVLADQPAETLASEIPQGDTTAGQAAPPATRGGVDVDLLRRFAAVVSRG